MKTAEQVVQAGETPATLWWSLIAGFLAWGADLGFSYSFAQHACSTGHSYVLPLIAVICFAVSISGFFTGLGLYRKVESDAEEEGKRPHDRAYFQALLGMGLSVGFAVVIIAAAIPHWILRPCD